MIQARYRQSRIWDIVGRYYTLKRYENAVNPLVNDRYIRFGRQQAGAKWQGSGLDWPLRDTAPLRISNAVSESTARVWSDRISTAVEMQTTKPLKILPNVHIVPDPIATIGEEVLQLFDGPLGKAVCDLYGAHFQVLWLDCYRTYPGSEQRSWLWHTDNVPPFIVKGLVYLTQVTADTGPTLILSPEKTKALKSVGYFPMREEHRPARIEENGKVPISSADIQTVFADPGDAVVFNTNQFHKAQPPKDGFRDAISIQLLPSRKPWREALTSRSLSELVVSGSFPSNPFST